jgi:hypothetical protein
MKIVRVGAELLHTDRWTDRYEAGNCRFSQFYESAYNGNNNDDDDGDDDDDDDKMRRKFYSFANQWKLP